MKTEDMPQPKDNLILNREYTRRLYENVLDWYKNADAKAQVILSLDGIFLTFGAASMFQHGNEVSRAPWYSIVLLGFMVIALCLSIAAAIACLWSQLIKQHDIEKTLSAIDISNHKTYEPEVLWFFQFIAHLDKSEFEKRMLESDPTIEIDALASQIYELSERVLKKHRFVNHGFLFAGIALIMFMASGISSVLSRL